MAFERQKQLTVWTLAGGVALGILTAHTVEAIATFIGARITFEYAMKEFQSATTKASADQAAEAEKQERIAQDARLAKAKQQRADAERQALINEAKDRKEAAWNAFYKKPLTCDNPPDNATFTKCANDFIKAQRAFEEQYKP